MTQGSELPIEVHYRLVGNVVSNLQSLEFMLRWWLTLEANMPTSPPIAAGQIVAVTPMTDWATLGQLVNRYNARLTKEEQSWRIDQSVVEIRDALAHGRVATPDPGSHLFLYRYTKPSPEGVTVKAIKPLDVETLKADASAVSEGFNRVVTSGFHRRYFHTNEGSTQG